MNPLLKIQNLSLSLDDSSSESVSILHDLSFEISTGEIVGLVGESGCGKSMTASAILGLLPSKHQLTGKISFEGQSLQPNELAQLRGNRLSLILQDPSAALNPVMRIEKQLTEGLCFHKKISYKQAYLLGIEWLKRVGINDPIERMRQYPHQLSGGMKQRILIAMALICRPSLLIADEPTTALDVTLQAQILELLQQLQEEEGTSILFITHDLGVVARCCQRVMVMYAGQLIETGPVEKVLINPQHPYTQALLHARQGLINNQMDPLKSIKGSPPRLAERASGFIFASRCCHARQICIQQSPPVIYGDKSSYHCWLSHAPQDIR